MHLPVFVYHAIYFPHKFKHIYAHNSFYANVKINAVSHLFLCLSPHSNKALYFFPPYISFVSEIEVLRKHSIHSLPFPRPLLLGRVIQLAMSSKLWTEWYILLSSLSLKKLDNDLTTISLLVCD